MKNIATALLLFTLPLLWVQSLRTTGNASAGELPEVVYLGQGDTYTISSDWNFIVKRINPFRFDLESGPTYTAAPNEHVWKTDSNEPPALYHAWLDFGHVPNGCVVSYVAIDDDVDDRVNQFYLDGNPIHAMAQGMVSRGEFSAPEAGQLTFYAADSIGMWVEICRQVIIPENTPTATATLTPTATATPTPTTTVAPTATLTLTPTLTATPAITPSGTTTATATLLPTATATGTGTPTAFATPTATSSPTPTPTRYSTTPVATLTSTATATAQPHKNACLRINFEVSGDVARAGDYVVREIGGRILFTWTAADGWQDSGWITEIDISHNEVFVEVWFYPADGSAPIRMEIVNPAPGTPHGWLARGVCHALEVGWPEMETAVETPPPPIVPTIPPQPTSSGGSLRRP